MRWWTFNAGLLTGTPISYKQTRPRQRVRDRHGRRQAVCAVAQAVDVRPRRAQPRRAEGHDRGQGVHAASGSAERRTSSASRSTGPTPHARRRRTSPPACCRDAPAASTGGCRRWATADYEWKGFLSEREHPHDVGGPGGLLLNWNNQSAPGFMHGDDEPYGSAQRVELFDKWPNRPQLTDVVGIMNRAATEDVRSPVWPVVSKVLRSGPAPSARDQQVRRHPRRLGQPRRSAPGRRRRQVLRRGRPGDHGRRLAADRRGGDAARVRRPHRRPRTTSATSSGRRATHTSTRTCARCSGDRVAGAFNLSYCGNGSLRGLPRRRCGRRFTPRRTGSPPSSTASRTRPSG